MPTGLLSGASVYMTTSRRSVYFLTRSAHVHAHRPQAVFLSGTNRPHCCLLQSVCSTNLGHQFGVMLQSPPSKPGHWPVRDSLMGFVRAWVNTGGLRLLLSWNCVILLICIRLLPVVCFSKQHCVWSQKKDQHTVFNVVGLLFISIQVGIYDLS